MNILVAPNALKGSLDPFEAARAIAEGLARGLPGVHAECLPIADGGDATAAVLVDALHGSFAEAPVSDPLGRPIAARFGLFGDGGEAVIEMAASSGLALLATNERDPMVATTYGAGELVRVALDRGARRILVALGGSATVDGGAGFVEALGARLLDAQGKPVRRGGAGLAAIARIDVTGLDPRLRDVELVALCDVDNGLLGEQGAAKTFGPQKGATPEMVKQLEAGLAHWSDAIARDLGRDVAALKHGGAAGGMGAGIAGILGGKLESGADWILARIDVKRRLAGQDVAITAEGHIDPQTLGNKAPYALARAARAAGVPVVAFAGGIADKVDTATFDLFNVIVPICPRPMPLDEAMARARELLTASAERTGRLLALVQRR
ncbi:MAG: glycerate kinase [Polyangiaceae bacterium]